MGTARSANIADLHSAENNLLKLSFVQFEMAIPERELIWDKASRLKPVSPVRFVRHLKFHLPLAAHQARVEPE